MLAIPAIMICTTMRASRPPDIKVGDAACKFPLLLGFLLQPAVVRLGHYCIINAQFQPMKPQTYSPGLDFYSTKTYFGGQKYDSSYPAGPRTADRWCHLPSLHFVSVLKV